MADTKDIFGPELIRSVGFDYKHSTAKTKNMTGYMRNYLCRISERFSTQEYNDDDRILEIGFGIGAVLASLLREGAENITAIDPDQEHIDAATVLLEKTFGGEMEGKLKFVCDELPLLSRLETNHFTSILSAQVLHFLKPDEFEIALKRIFDILMPGGTFFMTIGSPYIESYPGFAEEYEKRRGISKFPGFLENPKKFNPNGIQHHPGRFLFFDPVVLAQRVSEVGFNIVESCLLDDRSEKNAQTGLIAIKD
jgi:SAM-dependent methyltransferase